MANDALHRWQGRSIEQLGNTSNLLIAMAGGALALTVTMLREDRLKAAAPETPLLYIYAICFTVSLAAGLLVAVNRLQDYRLTAEIVRTRKKPHDDAQLEEMRATSRAYGAWTWRLFLIQLGSFGLGAIVFLFFLFHVLSAKLQ